MDSRAALPDQPEESLRVQIEASDGGVIRSERSVSRPRGPDVANVHCRRRVDQVDRHGHVDLARASVTWLFRFFFSERAQDLFTVRLEVELDIHTRHERSIR